MVPGPEKDPWKQEGKYLCEPVSDTAIYPSYLHRNECTSLA